MKKAAATEAPVEHEEELDQEMPEASGSDQEAQAPKVTESRKRAKPAKEIVAAKKPKSKTMKFGSFPA